MIAQVGDQSGLELIRQYFHLTLEEMQATVPSSRGPETGSAPGGQDLPRTHGGVALSDRPTVPDRSEWHIAPDLPYRPLNASRLAGLLHFGYGLSALETGPQSSWPYHRHVPSARCLFPAELQLGTQGGWFRYDPFHHRLERHRTADSSTIRGGCVLVISARFARTSGRYGDYAYRLICQEAGLLAGNLVLVAHGLGLAADAVPVPYPAGYDQLLAFPPGRESVLSAITVTEDGTLSPPALVRGWRGGRPPAPVPPPPVGQLMARVHDVFRLGMPPAPAARPAIRPADRPHCPPGCAPVPRATTSRPLRDALRKRESGEPGFRPAPAGIPFPVLGDILARALPAQQVNAELPAVRIAVAARTVCGLAAGIHLYSPACRGLHQVRAGDPYPHLASAEMAPVVNARVCPAVLWILTDREEWLSAAGPAAYVQSHISAGAIAQRCCVVAAAHGLTARIHNGYDTRSVLRAVSAASTVAPLFQILLTWPRATARYRLPIGLP